VLQLYIYENIQELNNNSCSSKLTNYVLDRKLCSFGSIDYIPEIAGYVSLMKVNTRTRRRVVCVYVNIYIYIYIYIYMCVATKQSYKSTKLTDAHLILSLVLCLARNLVGSM